MVQGACNETCFQSLRRNLFCAKIMPKKQTANKTVGKNRCYEA